MGFIGKAFETVVTGGANIRIALKTSDYEKVRGEYLQLFHDFDSSRTHLLRGLSRLGYAKRRGLRALRRVRRVLRRTMSPSDADCVGSVCGLPALKEVEAVIAEFDVAMHAASGLAAGAGVGMGSWALVSAFGTASTSTLIGTLHGAAATNPPCQYS